MVEAGSHQLVPQVAAGEVDLALVVLPVTDPLVTTTPLFDDPLVLATAPEHPFAGRRRVRVRDLDGLDLVMFRDGYDLREATFAACRRAGFEPVLAAVEKFRLDGIVATNTTVDKREIIADVVGGETDREVEILTIGVVSVPFREGERFDFTFVRDQIRLNRFQNNQKRLETGAKRKLPREVRNILDLVHLDPRRLKLMHHGRV